MTYCTTNERDVMLQDLRRIPQSYEVVTPPTSEPVTLDEAKRAAKVDYTEEDSTISSWIKQAREEVEVDASVCLMSQTLRLNMDWFPESLIEIRRYPVSSITSVIYTDASGSDTTVSASIYTSDLTSYPPRITPAYGQVWPVSLDQVKAVRVLFVAGYASASLVPEIAKQAIRLRVAMNVREREGMDYEKYQRAYESLVGKLRRFNVL